MKSIVAAVAVAVLVPGLALAEPMGMERWQEHHPEAARELGDWVRGHPEAAAKFFEWDGKHPERSKEFVFWSFTHPGENIDAFVVTHPHWEYFDVIMERHRPAAEAFIGWTRRHAKAAEELMNHPRGLEWAGHHLYADSWHMEHPYR